MVAKNKNRTAVQDRGINGHPTPGSTKVAGGGPHISEGTSPPETIASRHTNSPLAFMKRLAEDMDRHFEESEIPHGARMPGLLGRGLELFRREAGLMPVDLSSKLDVEERDGKFIVRADLPGMMKKGVKVEVRDGLLAIQDERRREAREEHEGRYY